MIFREKTRNASKDEATLSLIVDDSFYIPIFIGRDYFKDKGIDHNSFEERMPLASKFLEKVPVVTFDLSLEHRILLASTYVDNFQNCFLTGDDERGACRFRTYLIDDNEREFHYQILNLNMGSIYANCLFVEGKDLIEENTKPPLKKIKHSLKINLIDKGNIIFSIGKQKFLVLLESYRKNLELNINKEYRQQLSEKYGKEIEIVDIDRTNLQLPEFKSLKEKFCYIRKIFNLSYYEIQEDQKYLDYLIKRMKRR